MRLRPSGASGGGPEHCGLSDSDSISESGSLDLHRDAQSASSSRFPGIPAEDQGPGIQGQENGAQLSLAHPAIPDDTDADDKKVLKRPEWYQGPLLPPFREISGTDRIYKLKGKELDELIDQKIRDSATGNCWVWSGGEGIATYLGQKTQGLQDVIRIWNNQKQKMVKFLNLGPAFHGNLSQVLSDVQDATKLKIVQKLGKESYNRYAQFAEDGGDPSPVNPEDLFRSLHPQVSDGKSQDEIRKLIIKKSGEAWVPWPASSGNFRSAPTGAAGGGSATAAAASRGSGWQRRRRRRRGRLCQRPGG
jgi:hypothetical protein